MRSEEFRRHAHALVDWMADYLEAEVPRVAPATKPGDVLAQLPNTAPEHPETFEDIFRDFEAFIVPNMTHWNDPKWFAYFPANNSPPSVLAEMLTATLGAQCMSWQTSPAATELEQVVMNWLKKACDLPESMVGVLQDTASTATLVAMLTAREKFTHGEFGRTGTSPQTLRVYATDQAHSSIDKAVKLAGFGSTNLVRVATTSDLSMDPDALANAVLADLQAGHTPSVVCATVGTTSTTANDPLRAIGRVCDQHGLWFHVDAAYAGSAALLPEKRHLFEGLEYADSYVFNPHKWLLTNFDCTAYYVRDPDALLYACGLTPEYLRTAWDGDVPNFRDWGIQLGRRFRALKLYFVMRSYGVTGLQALLRNHIEMADALRAEVQKHPEFECHDSGEYGLVCLRATPQDVQDLNALNASILSYANGALCGYATHTVVDGKFLIRISIGQWRTTPDHVFAYWRALQAGLRAAKGA